MPAESGCTSTGTRTRWPASPSCRRSTARGNGDDRRRALGEGTERDCSTCSSGSTWNHQPIAPIRASARPTMPTATWVTSAATARVRPRANTMGHTVGAGSV